ncbi:MAG: hypothetical protein WBJ21_02280 [Burkholderiaceae bacterium]
MHASTLNPLSVFVAGNPMPGDSVPSTDTVLLPMPDQMRSAGYASE